MKGSQKSLTLTGCWVSALASALPASAQEAAPPVEWLSPAREISRGWSASRDTPAFELAIFPRPIQRAGADLALVTVRRPSFTLRSGFAGFIELTTEAETSGFHSGPWPGGGGPIYWRGSFGFFAALTPVEWGRRLCARCRTEATLTYRHESQHYTGSNAGDAGIDMSARPYVGDDFILDFGFAESVGEWYFAERAILLVFLPERSSYAGGLGVDLHARWLGPRWSQPFLSLYGEYLFGDDLHGRAFPDVYRLRALLGVALPSSMGDVSLFLSGDVGNRYGLEILTREATLGLGLRFAVGASNAEL
ncbi:MAG: hypothetical protein QM756_42695 [Polyangiaceae bacterium]